VQALITFLDDVGVADAGMSRRSDDDVSMQHVAMKELIRLATRQSWTYVLTHLDLFDWECIREVEELVPPYGARLKEVALEVWSSLPWEYDGRGQLVLFLEGC
jgi:hypothetical protein